MLKQYTAISPVLTLSNVLSDTAYQARLKLDCLDIISNCRGMYPTQVYMLCILAYIQFLTT